MTLATPPPSFFKAAPLRTRLIISLVGLITLMFGQAASAQISPSGYTGAINTPNADVMQPGTAALSISSSIPELRRTYPGAGYFGGINLGVGLLPGLEVMSRLIFDGDTECNMYRAGCLSTTRDLSLGLKYQLPLRNLPFDSRVALGLTDYGGAVTLFRQTYGVATSTVGPIDLSLGFSKAQVPGEVGLIDGMFYNASLYLTHDLKLLLEDDSREVRAGISYRWKVLEDWELAAGVSEKLTNNSSQQAFQSTLTLTRSLDGRTQRLANGKPLRKPGLWALPLLYEEPDPRPDLELLKALAKKNKSGKANLSLPEQASQIEASLREAGFSDLSIGRLNGGWHIKAEPREWRKNRMDALGVALAAWVRLGLDPNAQVRFTLTHLESPVMQATTTGMCVLEFMDGQNFCELSDAIAFSDDPWRMIGDIETTDWLVSDSNSSWLKPNFEFGPALSWTAGSEFGLFDYSVGLITDWEIPFYKGLSFQGSYVSNIYNTSEMKDPNSYFRRVGMGLNEGEASRLLVYTRPLYHRLWLEASSGWQSRVVKGENLSLSWSSPRGFLRVNPVAGNFKLDIPDLPTRERELRPRLLTARFNVVPGRWRLLYTFGTFLNNDKGFLATSSHFFGDTRFNFFYRRTGLGNFRTPFEREFAGFSVSIPIGPKRSYALGPVTFRGRDRFTSGLETKVGEKDNFIELHYGVSPGTRHGLFLDVLDSDRADMGSLLANRYRLRAMLRQQFGNN